MREKIYFLAKGMFTYEPPEPVIEPEKIETQVAAGTKAQVTITVSNKRETKLKGFGFCAAQEITFLPVFEGEKNILECEIDATELIAGTHLQGRLVLVTDCGETSVPYDIDITAPVLKDEEGMQVMRNLGRNMAWLLKCIELGKANGAPAPAMEREHWTNFIR